VLLVRQFRESVREELLEIPAGVFDVEGEDGAACAARELLEETGYRAGNMEDLAAMYTSPGFTNERIELYRANAEPAGDPIEDEVQVMAMPIGRALEALARGDIVDPKTIAGLLLLSNEA